MSSVGKMMGRPDEEKNFEVTSNTTHPSQCASRGKVEDAREAVKEVANLLQNMDPTVVQRMMQAREANLSILEVFPNGDERFKDDDSEEDYEAVEPSSQINGEEVGDDAAWGSCHGLLDDIIDPNPQVCLKRVKDEYQFDLMKEMKDADLDFLQRIRVVNFIRKAITGGEAASESISQAKDVIRNRKDDILGNDAYLVPIVEDDLLLTALEEDDESSAAEED